MTKSASFVNSKLSSPERIVLILPCCIGDVVLATATLQALRRAYPAAHITWAVGSWSKAVLEHHNLLDAVLDTGSAALPVKSWSGFWRFVSQLRAGHFDLAVSLSRSPLMSLAVMLSGIPVRAGLDSAGRGFGYSIRAPIDPQQPRHEADIYLDVSRALGLDVSNCWANVPVRPEDVASIVERISAQRFIVVHPGGGQNPGMTLDAKRWPPEHFAALAKRLTQELNAHLVLVGGPGDKVLVERVGQLFGQSYTNLAGQLSFGEMGALAKQAVVYIGNDTGMTHLAAASGGRTVMILGPSDPVRYAPFVPDALALWKPVQVAAGGVAEGIKQDWDWARDGIGVEEVTKKISTWLQTKAV